MLRPMKPALWILALSFFWAAGPSNASAFWCEQRLVRTGDALSYVRSVCGEPASAISRTESRTHFVGGTLQDGRTFGGTAVTTTVQIDVLVYDFGPTRFMEELTFENGVLVSSRRLGRGTRRRTTASIPGPTQ